MARFNAGGTNGGAGRFFIGLLMMVVGGYLFLDNVHVVNRFGMSTALFGFGGYNVRSGMVLVPFIFGVGMIFYNARSIIGWGLVIGSLAAFGFGIITSVQFRLRTMSAFDIMTILVLLVGGIGLFLNSLKNFTEKETPEN